MRHWILLILILLSTLSASTPSRAAPCLAALLQERRTYSEQTEASVVLEGVIDLRDPRGSRQKIRRLPGRSWYSRYASRPNAYQADPRTFVFALEDVEAARFFGFEVLSDRQAIVPNADRLNWALDAVEQASLKDGGEPIRFPIRMRRAKGIVTDRKYVEDFALHGHQPLAEGTEEMLHDLAYHSVSVLMPEAEAQHGIRLSQVILDFVHYLQKVDPKRMKQKRMQQKTAEIFALEGNKIDTGTGNVGYLLSRGIPEEAFNSGVRALTRNGLSPERWLQGVVFRVFKDDIAVQLQVQKFSHLRAKVDPSFQVPFELNAEDFESRMAARRKRIVEIVRRLQKHST